MSENVRLTLAIIVLLVGLFGEKAVQFVKDNVEIVDGVTYSVSEPSIEYKELVKPITEIEISKEDSELISSFYLELSDG